MSYCTYLYLDPKVDILGNPWRYVGKGDNKRPSAHLLKRADTRISRMLKKRVVEGFDVIPYIINAPSENSALAMEIFWIAVIGREDLGKGPLFNLTDGGEGISGCRRTDETKRKMSIKTKGKPKSIQHCLSLKRAALRPEVVEKKRKIALQIQNTPEHIEKKRAGLKSAFNTKAFKEKRSKTTIEVFNKRRMQKIPPTAVFDIFYASGTTKQICEKFGIGRTECAEIKRKNKKFDYAWLTRGEIGA